MDLQKEREAFEAWLISTEKFKRRNKSFLFMLDDFGTYEDQPVLEHWETWQAAKAQAVQGWISVEDNLPETEPNTDGVVCAVVCSLGNVYRARYVHDVDVGVDTKYWSEFAVNYNGKEYEHYEINAKITHWMPLPDAPQEQSHV